MERRKLGSGESRLEGSDKQQTLRTLEFFFETKSRSRRQHEGNPGVSKSA